MYPGDVFIDSWPRNAWMSVGLAASFGPLVGRVERSAAGAAERVVEDDAAGRTDRFGDVPGAAEGHGGDPVGLQMTGDQTHGLVGDGSDGHEEGGVHLVCSQLGQDLGG